MEMTRIGRYQMIRLLGQGGMGRIMLARDTVLARQVAIKLVRDDLGLPPELRGALFDRMRQEARAVAGLSHPHMITLHDMGEDQEVGFYLVFEYIEGPTLRHRIHQSALSAKEAAKIARELGGALTYIHNAGVIHRDVKPENILLSPFGAKLTDFGIARLPGSTLTRISTIMSTPSYTAPEALARNEFSAKSDQFSLAVTLYEALTQRQAFPGEHGALGIGRTPNDTIPPLFELDSSKVHLSHVDPILARGAAKDPQKRYDSCLEFVQEFSSSLEVGQHNTKHVYIQSSTSKPLLSSRARRIHNLVVTGAIILLALLVARSYWTSRRGVSLQETVLQYTAAIAAIPPPAPRSKPVQSSSPKSNPPHIPTHTSNESPSKLIIDAGSDLPPQENQVKNPMPANNSTDNIPSKTIPNEVPLDKLPSNEVKTQDQPSLSKERDF
ncbi:serine/threonine-protein kinase [Pajaroellobacter abortibovis]|uniref:Protein kinase domain-containing protein n=1 Tax=Pajaroellobacter abortibovis TaxID=1882918 RepID=A0A1L6MX51_9BACT|nr:serine/threonine-protein kinase [Pajaroellobacter abortibovis]APS00009.1 hypothetical protein BCY86_04390 [Pajaroellobacter abortibovis]